LTSRVVDTNVVVASDPAAPPARLLDAADALEPTLD
jgi:hypothetical protein